MENYGNPDGNKDNKQSVSLYFTIFESKLY